MDMSTDEEPSKKSSTINLRNILQCTAFCTVCLDINEDLLQLDNTFVKGNCDGDLLSLRGILEGIFGNANNILSDYICGPCKSTAASTFAFITKAKRTAQEYAEYLNQLDKKTANLTSHIKDSSRKNTMILLELYKCVKKEEIKPKKICKQLLYICELCGKGYNRKINLIKHIKQHKCSSESRQVRKRKGRIYKCLTCNKVLKTKLELRKHVKQMHEKKPNMCNYCNKQFGSRKEYLEHVQTQEHRKNTPYNMLKHQCSHCDYAANTIIMLTAHINRIHLNIRPFVCKYCQKCYFGKIQLASHMKIHTGQAKSKVCDICGANLSGPTSLKKHRRLHTGENPYPCPYCNDKMICTSSLKSHIMRKHMEPTISCPLCDQKFHTMKNARGHVKNAHWKSKEKFDYTKLKGLLPEDYEFFRDRRKAII